MSAKPTHTANADGSTTASYKLSEMSVEQLVMVNQGLGNQIDKLRADRLKTSELIAAKLVAERRAGVVAEIERLQKQIDGEAPGAVIDASASQA